jgi:hypothetical protein
MCTCSPWLGYYSSYRGLAGAGPTEGPVRALVHPFGETRCNRVPCCLFPAPAQRACWKITDKELELVHSKPPKEGAQIKRSAPAATVPPQQARDTAWGAALLNWVRRCPARLVLTRWCFRSISPVTAFCIVCVVAGACCVGIYGKPSSSMTQSIEGPLIQNLPILLAAWEMKMFAGEPQPRGATLP